MADSCAQILGATCMLLAGASVGPVHHINYLCSDADCCFWLQRHRCRGRKPLLHSHSPVVVSTFPNSWSDYQGIEEIVPLHFSLFTLLGAIYVCSKASIYSGRFRKSPCMPRKAQTQKRPRKTLNLHLRLITGTETPYNNKKWNETK